MERLVTSSEAAHLLGLSLQGIHYRIKTGKLKAEKKDGKTFVYVNDPKQTEQNIDNIIVIKDEQILFLQKSLKWIKKQYKSEINRLEKNQDKMMQVFQSEINLLQSAFNEMRSIYHLDHKEIRENQKDESKMKYTKESTDFEIMDIKDFFIFMKQSNKSNSQIKALILDRVKQGDNRFIFNRKTKEVIIYKSDFVDLI